MKKLLTIVFFATVWVAVCSGRRMVWPTSTSQHDDLWRKKRQASSDPINP
ncbi:MAG: hypothetical protein Ta2E_09200 [Mycoplasmoidaceae bacterium]|nr:MAG: hypothetical protein Ta2E_09200 [Mycoplasmoidaceae bacterium]